MTRGGSAAEVCLFYTYTKSMSCLRVKRVFISFFLPITFPNVRTVSVRIIIKILRSVYLQLLGIKLKAPIGLSVLPLHVQSHMHTQRHTHTHFSANVRFLYLLYVIKYVCLNNFTCKRLLDDSLEATSLIKFNRVLGYELN